MKAIDLTAQRRDLHVRFDRSPVYDFLAALYLVRHWAPDKGFDIDPAWVTSARTILGPKVMEDAKLLLPRHSPILGIVSLLEEHQGSDVRTFLGLVQRTAPVALLERMVAGSLTMRPMLPLLRQALAADGAAREAFLDAYPPEYDRAALRRILDLPPAEVQARLLRLLRTFHTRVYAKEEPRVIPVLAADLEARQAMSRLLSPVEIVERATGGFLLTPEAGVGAVLLAPTYFFRPYNLITEYHGMRVFIYPVEPREEDDREAHPPQELVRLYKALGDETRLRILRMLAQREMYVQEIAKALGMSHVTAIHHLAQLRAAHLVQVVERDNLRYYRLRYEASAEVERRWREYVDPQRQPRVRRSRG